MRAHLRRAIALLSLLSAVASVLLAGQSYFSCPWMQRTSKGCCCPAERLNTEEPAISRAPCCERKTIATMPAASTDLTRQAASVLPANAFSGELIRLVDQPTADATEWDAGVRERGARAGPAPNLFALHSTYLI